MQDTAADYEWALQSIQGQPHAHKVRLMLAQSALTDVRVQHKLRMAIREATDGAASTATVFLSEPYYTNAPSAAPWEHLRY